MRGRLYRPLVWVAVYDVGVLLLVAMAVRHCVG